MKARNTSYPDDQVPQDIVLCSDPELASRSQTLARRVWLRETNPELLNLHLSRNRNRNKLLYFVCVLIYVCILCTVHDVA